MNYFLTKEEHAIVGLVALPEENGIRIYVLWDWENQVKEHDIFSAYKSRYLYKELNEKNILETCKIGFKMSADEAKKIFGHLGLF